MRAIAGTAFCASNAPCILGAAVVGAVAGNKLGEKFWDHIPRLPHLPPEPELDYASLPPPSKQFLRFFKPSETVARWEKPSSYTPEYEF